MNIKLVVPLLAMFVLSAHAEMKVQTLDYSDALESLENPCIGFYRTQVYHFKSEGNKAASTWGNLSHLRMDISEFSDKAVISIDKTSGDTTFGASRPLTQDALDAFEATLDNIRQRGKSAIVRFSYDSYFEGYKNCDPEQSVILGHLRQLGEVYARNTDVISFVELGMYGSWGEMHSSNFGTNENIAEALQTLLECTPPAIKIGVRRPDIIATWLGVNEGNNYDGFGIETEKFLKAAEKKGDTIFRVGMYNDGYLGSDSDLGTIGMGASGHNMTREMMVQWLEAYSRHTPYGGELVANQNGDHPINTPSYLSQEGFRTHTSYLNYEWHQPTILSWKDSIFNGGDPEYDGKDGFTYVENHLGYRFILRESAIEDSVTSGDKLNIKLLIENVGFGNLTKNSEVTFILKDEENIFELRPDKPIDPMEWLSEEKNEVNATLTLPQTNANAYDLYVRLSEYGKFPSDNNYHCIQFGNAPKQFDSSIGANKIGNINILASQNTSNQETFSTKNIDFRDGKLHITGFGLVEIYDTNGGLIIKREISGEENFNIPGHQGEIVLCVLYYQGNAQTYKIQIP